MNLFLKYGNHIFEKGHWHPNEKEYKPTTQNILKVLSKGS